jgi:hypothetical protein
MPNAPYEARKEEEREEKIEKMKKGIRTRRS